MEIKAEFLLPTKELRKDIPFFTNTLKMQMDMIYPADNPTVAVFSGHGIRIRIDKEAIISPGKIKFYAKTRMNLHQVKRYLKHQTIPL